MLYLQSQNGNVYRSEVSVDDPTSEPDLKTFQSDIQRDFPWMQEATGKLT